MIKLRHFNLSTGKWLNNPFTTDNSLTENLENSLLEHYFPGRESEFSIGQITDENREDKFMHPNGDTLLLSSGSRLLYGPAECLETIEKLCPDAKDRGAYGSLFLGSCNNSITKDQLNVLVVDDDTGKNNKVIDDRLAWGLTGDCHGKITPKLALELLGTDNQVIQHRLSLPALNRFGKGTLAPADLPKGIDLVLPKSSFKGGLEKIKPGLYQTPVWIGVKDYSRETKICISQLYPSFPDGMKDFLRRSESDALQLATKQTSVVSLAHHYCEKKANSSQNTDDLPMYKIIKADLENHQQLLNSPKVVKELKRFAQNQWKEIAIGRNHKFERAMIIPSKKLKNGEICVPYLPEGEEIINFRSPVLNSNGVCISKNVYVPEAYNHRGLPLEGVIVVNDETIDRMRARGVPEAQIPMETETQAQARDFDGDTVGFALAVDYPALTKSIKERNLNQNRYEPVKKEEKRSFGDLSFERIARIMANSPVGQINNQLTGLIALESEMDIIDRFGTHDDKSKYVEKLVDHYQKLIKNNDLDTSDPKHISPQYHSSIRSIANTPSSLTPEVIKSVLAENKKLYRSLIASVSYENQVAVDMFKSNRQPNLKVIEEAKIITHRTPSYIVDKKKSHVYIDSPLTSNGNSPVEILINQTNNIFNSSTKQLEPLGANKFKGLFPNDFTPAQKLKVQEVKRKYDQLLSLAIESSAQYKQGNKKRFSLFTASGNQIEVYDLRQKINQDDTFVKTKRDGTFILVDTTNKYVASIKKSSAQKLKLKNGDRLSNCSLEQLEPLTPQLIRLYFKNASDYAKSFSDSVKALNDKEKQQFINTTWHLSHSSKGTNNSNFAYVTFPDEIAKQVQSSQLRSLTITGLQYDENQGASKYGQVQNFEVQENSEGKKLLLSDGQQMGFIRSEDNNLSSNLKFKGIITADHIYTATLKLPNYLTPIKFGKVNEHHYQSTRFTGESVNVELINYQPPPVPVIKLNNKIIGEIDDDSYSLLKSNKQNQVVLDSFGDGFSQYSLASLPDNKCIKITNQHRYQNQVFDSQSVVVQIGIKKSTPSLAVKVNGRIAGVFTCNQKASQDALAQHLKTNNLSGARFKANIESNLTTAKVNVIRDSVAKKTLSKDGLQLNYQEIIDRAMLATFSDRQQDNPFLLALKKLPTIPWKLTENNQEKYLISIDTEIEAKTTQWLGKKNIKHFVIPSEEENLRGYSVIELDPKMLPPPVEKQLLKSNNGQWLSGDVNFSTLSDSPYHDRLYQYPPLDRYQQQKQATQKQYQCFRQPWEKNMLKIAIQSLKPNPQNSQQKKGRFHDRYQAVLDQKTNTITISSSHGIIYRAKKGEKPQINKVSPTEKRLFSKDKQRSSMAR